MTKKDHLRSTPISIRGKQQSSDKLRPRVPLNYLSLLLVSFVKDYKILKNGRILRQEILMLTFLAQFVLVCICACFLCEICDKLLMYLYLTLYLFVFFVKYLTNC